MNRRKKRVLLFISHGRRFSAALRSALRDVSAGPAASISTLSPVSAERL